MAKTRAYDKLFFDTGFDEEDVVYSFAEHQVESNPEFKSMMADCQAKYKENIQVLLNKLAGPNGGQQTSTNPFHAGLLN